MKAATGLVTFFEMYSAARSSAVPPISPISKIASVADLRGKKVALNKGSNVHYLLVKALEKAGLKYTDIETVFLAPADARAAYRRYLALAPDGLDAVFVRAIVDRELK